MRYRYEKGKYILQIVIRLLAIGLIIFLTLFRRTVLIENQAVLIPFDSFAMIWRVGWGGHGKYIARGLFANILLFVPFGISISDKERHASRLMLPFLISLIVETIQYFTRLGTFEVDDLICNTIGGILGYELGTQNSGQRKGNFIMPGIYLAALGLCCLKSILFN